MILSPGAFVRVAILLLLAVVLQVSVLSQLTIFGGHADLVVLAVAATAYYAGSVTRLRDRVRGRAAARPAERDDDGRLVARADGGRLRRRPLPRGARSEPRAAAGGGRHGGDRGWVIAFAAVALMLDIGARVSPLVLRDMFMTILLNALLALPVFTGCRKLLRPSLAVDPLEVRRRRRPPREAGPLGLRGLEV